MELVSLFTWLAVAIFGILVAFKLFPENNCSESALKKHSSAFFRIVIVLIALLHPLFVTYPSFLGDGMPAKLVGNGKLQELPYGAIGFNTFRMKNSTGCGSVEIIRLDNGINFQVPVPSSSGWIEADIIDKYTFYKAGSRSYDNFCYEVHELLAKEMLAAIRSGLPINDDQPAAKNNAAWEQILIPMQVLEPKWGVRFQK